jgi:hypothetical protein
MLKSKMNNSHALANNTGASAEIMRTSSSECAWCVPMDPDPDVVHDSLTLTSDNDDDDDHQDHQEDYNQEKAEEEIWQSAEKLLQWASYGSSVATSQTVSSAPDHSSVASPSSSSNPTRQQSLLDYSVPRTIQSLSYEDDDADNDHADEEISIEQEDDQHEDDHSSTPSTPSRAQRLMTKFEQAVTNL